MVSEESIVRSFANVKEEVKKIQANILEISGEQAELFKMITELRNSLDKMLKEKSSPKRKKK